VLQWRADDGKVSNLVSLLKQNTYLESFLRPRDTCHHRKLEQLPAIGQHNHEGIDSIPLNNPKRLKRFMRVNKRCDDRCIVVTDVDREQTQAR
jgi:hypothetical protein